MHMAGMQGRAEGGRNRRMVRRCIGRGWVWGGGDAQEEGGCGAEGMQRMRAC